MKIRLILADDHPAVIAGIRHTLAGISTVDVVGTARNSTELAELLSQVPCDVLITDYAMPGGEYGDGLALLSFLRRRYPELEIIVFTTIDNPAVVHEIAKLGVKSVLSKVDDMKHLIFAIHTVHSGAAYFSSGTMTQHDLLQIGRADSKRVQELSKREAEVVRLYASGQSINEIAGQLHRSKKTVSAQKMSAMRKLGIQRDADLFRFAYEVGLTVSTDARPDA
ncbi:response regulator transcription factor [Paraburkholderia aspalathi]|uniref:response regulator transcription factor n=1 Tax=Paraburkholderia nemoris TaxID=2793076 RepID=UPI0019090D80|nr:MULTISPECIES: response regulator transcription factor [Paraburkholderia]MBK3787194.1 response regulator transcription factor [Paraburkholderia aspalathi]